MNNYKVKEQQLQEVADIRGELLEPKPLPMGVTEFHEWSNRIITGALIPGATERSQKFALANMVMHLGPTEAFKPDGYFIQVLRKNAANLVADQVIKDIRKEFEDEAKAKAQKVETQPVQ